MGKDPIARARLERWVRGATTPQRLVQRSRIVLLAMDGLPPDEIAARVGLSRRTVIRWIGRFERGGPGSLLRDAPGRGRRPSLDSSTLHRCLAEAHLLAPDGRPISLRRAAKFLRVSPTAVWRALRRVDENSARITGG